MNLTNFPQTEIQDMADENKKSPGGSQNPSNAPSRTGSRPASRTQSQAGMRPLSKTGSQRDHQAASLGGANIAVEIEGEKV